MKTVALACATTEGSYRFQTELTIGNQSAVLGRAQTILPTLPPQHYDLIYIDGSHIAADVLADGCASWRLVKPGGLVIFDDYRWGWHKPPVERPKLGIDQFWDEFQARIEVIDKGYQVIVRKSVREAN